MKIYVILTIFFTLIFTNYVHAFEYTEADKEMFYNAFLDGYFTEMEKSVNKLDITQEKKNKFISLLKERTNKNELINSSWSCIKKYPIDQIVAASVICTADWNKKQSKNNKDLFDLLKLSE